jgi:hypothetical protein
MPTGRAQTIATHAERQDAAAALEERAPNAVAPQVRSFKQGARGLPTGHHLAEAAATDGTPIHNDVGAVDE